MSENGPREGSRDLPRRDRESGFRAVDENSAAGLAYRNLSRSVARRRAELAAMAEAGIPLDRIAEAYETDHPLEPRVSPVELARLKFTHPRRATPPASSDSPGDRV